MHILIVEDFICLGRTVPEESKKYGHKVCMAGYSHELNSLLRVYPLPVVNPLKMRHRYVLGLCRNPSDSRNESWKMVDRIAAYESTDCVSSQAIKDVLKSCCSESIDQLNEQRLSLGVLRCESIEGEFTLRENCGTTQLELFETCDYLFGAKAVKAAPYLRFSSGGKSHRLQLREWGCYEWIRKNPSNCRQLWANLRLDRDDIYLLVGNMANRRNVWLVISVFAYSKEQQPTLQLN